MDYITPFLVKIKLREVNSVKEMLLDWKKEHLTTNWEKNFYAKITSEQEPIGKLRGYGRMVSLFIKYFWPILVGILAAEFFNVVQFGLISIPLVLFQLIIFLIAFVRIIMAFTIAAVVELEKSE